MIALLLVLLGIWGIGEVCIGIVWIAMGLLALIAQACGRDQRGL